eukprot:TRINITY_DN8871_c0_g1_i1.p1 TRINITY_DN8871_c0_g1~~TRINITY_DN8871_c0_g1_i1.p1  ORF type:complete len:304 (+),score=23.99 TRINITY_DN8871_c0_g1_i1:187-1098(+)
MTFCVSSFLRSYPCWNLTHFSSRNFVRAISVARRKYHYHNNNRHTVGHKYASATVFAKMSTTPSRIKYLGQQEAQQIDVELMSKQGFSIDQLMELAGLSCACSIATAYAEGDHARLLVVVGPGNNGGDGLVAARHLHHFGRQVDVYYPKRTNKQLYKNLMIQCENLGIRFLEDMPSCVEIDAGYDVVVDAIFGFGFKASGPLRAPFDTAITTMCALRVPIASIDVPSGWDVEKGPAPPEAGTSDSQFIQPDLLVSLTAPKQCASAFRGRHHFLGGRFVPPEISRKYELNLPPYEGVSQCVRLQ